MDRQIEHRPLDPSVSPRERLVAASARLDGRGPSVDDRAAGGRDAQRYAAVESGADPRPAVGPARCVAAGTGTARPNPAPAGSDRGVETRRPRAGSQSSGLRIRSTGMARRHWSEAPESGNTSTGHTSTGMTGIRAPGRPAAPLTKTRRELGLSVS